METGWMALVLAVMAAYAVIGFIGMRIRQRRKNSR